MCKLTRMCKLARMCKRVDGTGSAWNRSRERIPRLVPGIADAAESAACADSGGRSIRESEMDGEMDGEAALVEAKPPSNPIHHGLIIRGHRENHAWDAAWNAAWDAARDRDGHGERPRTTAAGRSSGRLAGR